jgi:hypothetical protein
MPDLMIRYRAAAFWGRLYIPELLVGIQTQEEVLDIEPVVISEPAPVKASVDDLNQKIAKAATVQEEVLDDDEIF